MVYILNYFYFSFIKIDYCDLISLFLLMSERLYLQVIDIFIYDLNNKYESLKIKGINKNNINNYINDYDKYRINDLIKDINRIKDINNYSRKNDY